MTTAEVLSGPIAGPSTPRRAPTLNDLVQHVGPDAPLFVAKATLASAAAGATAGATIGVVRSLNPFALSTSMGINCGLAGMTFFGLREYVVSPCLGLRRDMLHHRQTVGPPPGTIDSESGDTAGDISQRGGSVRWDNLADSALAGSLAGGILSGFLRGRHTVVRAGITAALVAATAQMGVNELRLARLRLLASRRTGDVVFEADCPVTPPPRRPQVESPTPMPQQTKRQVEAQPMSTGAVALVPQKIMGALSAFLPVKKLSDEEYLAVLERKRREVDQRLEEIQKEELKIFESSQKA